MMFVLLGSVFLLPHSRIEIFKKEESIEEIKEKALDYL